MYDINQVRASPINYTWTSTVRKLTKIKDVLDYVYLEVHQSSIKNNSIYFYRSTIFVGYSSKYNDNKQVIASPNNFQSIADYSLFMNFIMMKLTKLKVCLHYVFEELGMISSLE